MIRITNIFNVLTHAKIYKKIDLLAKKNNIAIHDDFF